MNPLVFNEAVALSERFLTLSTLIRTFSSVTSVVQIKFGFGFKGFPTFPALINPFTSVNSLVSNKWFFG